MSSTNGRDASGDFGKNSPKQRIFTRTFAMQTLSLVDKAQARASCVLDRGFAARPRSGFGTPQRNPSAAAGGTRFISI